MTVIGVVMVFAAVAAIIVGSIALEPMLGRKAILAGGMSGWFMALIGGYFVWMYTGAIYATIERFESQLGGIADIFE